MDKHTFRIRVAQAGYSQEEATRIESILRRTASIPVSREELRDAAFEYLVICTDVDKLLAYLRDVDNLSRGRCISWGAAADIVSHIVAQWWGGKKMTEKVWARLGGKDGVYLVEGEDYTVDRDAGLLTINEKAWAKVPARCIKDMDVQVDVGVYAEEGREEKR